VSVAGVLTRGGEGWRLLAGLSTRRVETETLCIDLAWSAAIFGEP
jgi:hypothetical protein